MKWAKFTPLFFLLTFIGCHQEPPAVSTLKPLDLHAYGIPMVILAPDSTMVLEKDYQFMRDMIFRREPDFDIQLFELTSDATDASGEKMHQLTSVRKDPFFRELIRDEDHGFIFSKNLDSLNVDYDFRFIKLFGDKELIFQTGLARSFTLDQVTKMYQAIQQ